MTDRNTFPKMKSAIILSFFVTVNFGVFAQEVPEVIHPTPEAMALEKFIDIPVNYHSGLAQINIPFFEARLRDISVPVSLSYHPGGIRVEEIASRSGLGWSLMAGGMISRTVRGMADDHPAFGFLYTSNTVQQFLAAPSHHVNYGSKGYYADMSIARHVDYEPDLFSYSFPGGSGQFVFDQNGDVMTIPQNNLRIEMIEGSTGIDGFKITDEGGFKYYFGTFMGNHARDSTGFTFAYTDDSSSGGIPNTNDIERFYNGWHLMAVESPMHDERITFGYRVHHTKNVMRGSQKLVISGVDCPNAGGVQTSYSMSENFETTISHIQFGNGLIEFEYDTTEREDLEGDHALRKVVYYSFGAPVKSFELVHGYFVSQDENTTVSPFGFYNKKYLTHRLYLDRIKQWDAQEGESLDYKFHYNSFNTLPNRFSYAQDLWGYYNGATANTSLIPEHFSYLGMVGENEVIPKIDGADRRTRIDKVTALVLNAIEHPTGGKTMFEFESHGVRRMNSGRHYVNTYFAVDEYDLVYFHYQSGQPTVFMDTVTVDSTLVGRTLRFRHYTAGCQGDPGGGIESCGFQVHIQGLDLNYSRSVGYVDESYFDLPEGTYKVTITVLGTTEGGNVSSGWVRLTGFLNGSPYAHKDEYAVGGLRIRRIEHVENAASVHSDKLIKEFAYHDDEYTSGVLAREFVFLQEGIKCGTSAEGTQTTRYAQSMNGACAAPKYTAVQEYSIPKSGSGSMGKSTYRYDIKPDVQQYSSDWMGTPYLSWDWASGNLLENTVWKSTGASFSKMQESVNQYDYTFISIDSLYRKVTGVMVVSTGGPNVHWSIYDTQTGGNHVERTISKSFESGQEVVTRTDYLYERRFLRPSKTVTVDAYGDTLVAETLYSDERHLIEGLSQAEKDVLTNMYHQRNMRVPVYNKMINVTKGAVLSKNLTVYEEADGKFRTHKIRTWDRDLGAFVEEAVLSYNNAQQYAQIDQRTSPPVTFLWAYDNTLPVAKVMNATLAQVQQALGSNYAALQQTTNSANIQNILADLRQALPSSAVLGYTYNSAQKMASQTDPNGLTTTFHYDTFGRLSHVRDHEGNILATNEYVYKSHE
jgi:YD repeat-containing protein